MISSILARFERRDRQILDQDLEDYRVDGGLSRGCGYPEEDLDLSRFEKTIEPEGRPVPV
jgi:hypothetical protein